jgi:hypothetical protein
MTDRELLELAAKAAGYPIHSDAMFVKAGGGVETLYMGKNGPAWNPLTDDGDALRLAVQLKLSVWFEPRENHEWTHIIWVSPVFEPYRGDTNAATRRAIVRAAAEIGMAMP